MTYTEEQLQSALVLALPKKLYMEFAPCWKTGGIVRETEWPAIVGMVEDGLTDEQIWQVESLVVDYHVAPNAFPLFSRSEVIKSRRAKWTIRAQALADIGILVIK